MSMRTHVTSQVVLVPTVVICPTCSSFMHTPGHGLQSQQPPPDAIGMRCLNGKCPEYRALKLVPLQRMDVTVEAEGEPDEPEAPADMAEVVKES